MVRKRIWYFCFDTNSNNRISTLKNGYRKLNCVLSLRVQKNVCAKLIKIANIFKLEQLRFWIIAGALAFLNLVVLTLLTAYLEFFENDWRLTSVIIFKYLIEVAIVDLLTIPNFSHPQIALFVIIKIYHHHKSTIIRQK